MQAFPKVARVVDIFDGIDLNIPVYLRNDKVYKNSCVDSLFA